MLGVVKCINSRFYLTPDVKEVCLCRGIEKLISRALSRLSFRWLKLNLKRRLCLSDFRMTLK